MSVIFRKLYDESGEQIRGIFCARICTNIFSFECKGRFTMFFIQTEKLKRNGCDLWTSVENGQ